MGFITIYDIIVYIVIGFVFMHLFNFIATNKNQTDFQHIFFKSLIVGFVVVNITLLIPFKFDNQYLNTLTQFAIAVLLSFLSAQLYGSILFKKILNRLNIRRTVNPYIWNDIEDKSQTLWVRIGFKELDIKYIGILACIEDFQRQPIIVLSNYSRCGYCEDENGDTAIDFTSEHKQRVVLDTSKADFIELIYSDDSKMITKPKDCKKLTYPRLNSKKFKKQSATKKEVNINPKGK